MVKLNVDTIYGEIKKIPFIFNLLSSGLNIIENNKHSLLIQSAIYELNELNKNIIFDMDLNHNNSLLLFTSVTKKYYTLFKDKFIVDEHNNRLENEDNLCDIYYLKNILILLDIVMYITSNYIQCDVYNNEDNKINTKINVIFNDLLNDYINNLINNDYTEIEIYNVKHIKLTDDNINNINNINKINEEIIKTPLTEEELLNFDTFQQKLKSVNTVEELLDMEQDDE